MIIIIKLLFTNCCHNHKDYYYDYHCYLLIMIIIMFISFIICIKTQLIIIIIIISIKSVFNNPSHVSAYRLVILIHEFGHLFVRSKCSSFQQVLEYKSLEYSFEQCCSEKPLKRKKKKIVSIPESGFQFEEQIFGMRIKKLTSRAAEFLIIKENWSSKNFAKEFKRLNSLKDDPNSIAFETVRMRTMQKDSRINWCLTSYYRMKYI